ncbi:MAG: thiamine diphosphokinase [Ignavibacteriae bacterium]|nr:thiamine diphosphokinase [Ignavibacteriota bacterium]
MKKAILIANGDKPTKKIISYFQKLGYKTIICADGGANSAKKIKVIPDFIIGDLDSVTNETLKYFRGKSEIIKLSRQNDTDVEKALKFLIKKKYNEIVLLGATGDRLDHSLCNIGIVLKFFDKMKITLVHKNSILKAYTGIVNIETEIGETISLYGIESLTKITSVGLKYKLKNIPLPFGEKESTSNMAVAQNIKLKISNGKILVVRDLKTLIKYDLV